MNYPRGTHPIEKQKIQYQNRGMTLENDINLSNQYYVEKNIAFIYKKPTPIQVTKVDYLGKHKVVIREAYFKEASTTDYNGLYRGKYIDFEAKETKNLTSFPLDNIHSHQIKHLRNIESQGGIAFLIIRFSRKQLTFLLPARAFFEYIDSNIKSSIPLEYFQKRAFIVEEKYIPRLDYIPIIDQIIGGVI